MSKELACVICAIAGIIAGICIGVAPFLQTAEEYHIYDFTNGANFTTNKKPLFLENWVIYDSYSTDGKKTFTETPNDSIIILYKHGNKDWAWYHGKKVNNLDAVQIPVFNYSMYRSIKD